MIFWCSIGAGERSRHVSILEMQGHVLKVKATAGDTYLGGEDLDDRMLRYAVEEFKTKHHKDISSNPRALSRLRTACERAKRNLSFAAETSVEVYCLHESIDFSCRFTRTKFEDLNEDLFNRCLAIVGQCLQDAGMKGSELESGRGQWLLTAAGVDVKGSQLLEVGCSKN